MSNYKIEAIYLDVPPGMVIYEMQRLACIAALENSCEARFVHNGKLYIARPRELLDQVRNMDDPWSRGESGMIHGPSITMVCEGGDDE